MMLFWRLSWMRCVVFSLYHLFSISRDIVASRVITAAGWKLIAGLWVEQWVWRRLHEQQQQQNRTLLSCNHIPIRFLHYISEKYGKFICQKIALSYFSTWDIEYVLPKHRRIRKPLTCRIASQNRNYMCSHCLWPTETNKVYFIACILIKKVFDGV